METLGAPPSSNKPKLLEQVQEVIRRKHYSIRTEQAYCDWIKWLKVHEREGAFASTRGACATLNLDSRLFV